MEIAGFLSRNAKLRLAFNCSSVAGETWKNTYRRQFVRKIFGDTSGKSNFSGFFSIYVGRTRFASGYDEQRGFHGVKKGI